MVDGKRVVVIMPAYNASKTLEATYTEIPMDLVDEVVLVDDFSSDDTTAKAEEIGIKYIIRHHKNKGYGANQKTCYQKALSLGADIVIMVHPDYQYSPKLIPSMCYLISSGFFQVVLGSRILGKGALKGGMPFYKYVFNRLLTFFQNVLIGAKLSEYHTGYRAFSREILEKINIAENSDNFVFDNQMLAQIVMKGYTIGEVSCPTKYFDEGSSINFKNSVQYGWGVVWTSIQFRMHKWRISKFKIFK